ncbi:MAG TPA: hypothetical protein VM940_13645, partial [Chthoniobacterales bacterium]|nr:hypothetical protein [Chthoniobacterales bacterium]
VLVRPMRRGIFGVCLLWCSVSLGAPPPPLEDLLRRAETVVLARVKAASADSVTFERVEALRGDTEVEITLGFDQQSPAAVQFEVDAQVLLLSQGDARFGPPRPLLGRGMHGQLMWCGWIALPIIAVGSEPFVDRIFSFADGDPATDLRDDKHAALRLARVRRLVARFPYDPHSNGKA